MNRSEKHISIIASFLIASTVLLTITSVLSIWEVLESDVVWKSLKTMFVLIVSSLLIAVALDPNHSQKKARQKNDRSLAGWIILIILILWTLSSWLF